MYFLFVLALIETFVKVWKFWYCEENWIKVFILKTSCSGFSFWYFIVHMLCPSLTMETLFMITLMSQTPMFPWTFNCCCKDYPWLPQGHIAWEYLECLGLCTSLRVHLQYLILTDFGNTLFGQCPILLHVLGLSKHSSRFHLNVQLSHAKLRLLQNSVHNSFLHKCSKRWNSLSTGLLR